MSTQYGVGHVMPHRETLRLAHVERSIACTGLDNTSLSVRDRLSVEQQIVWASRTGGSGHWPGVRERMVITRRLLLDAMCSGRKASCNERIWPYWLGQQGPISAGFGSQLLSATEIAWVHALLAPRTFDFTRLPPLQCRLHLVFNSSLCASRTYGCFFRSVNTECATHRNNASRAALAAVKLSSLSKWDLAVGLVEIMWTPNERLVRFIDNHQRQLQAPVHSSAGEVALRVWPAAMGIHLRRGDRAGLGGLPWERLRIWSPSQIACLIRARIQAVCPLNATGCSRDVLVLTDDQRLFAELRTLVPLDVGLISLDDARTRFKDEAFGEFDFLFASLWALAQCDLVVANSRSNMGVALLVLAAVVQRRVPTVVDMDGVWGTDEMERGAFPCWFAWGSRRKLCTMPNCGSISGKFCRSAADVWAGQVWPQQCCRLPPNASTHRGSGDGYVCTHSPAPRACLCVCV